MPSVAEGSNSSVVGLYLLLGFTFISSLFCTKMDTPGYMDPEIPDVMVQYEENRKKDTGN